MFRILMAASFALSLTGVASAQIAPPPGAVTHQGSVPSAAPKGAMATKTHKMTAKPSPKPKPKSTMKPM